MKLFFLSFLFFHSEMVSAANFQSKLEAILKKHQVPGLAAARSKAGKIDIMEVVGVRKSDDLNNKLSKDDQFHLGSCTKAMTATLIAMLVEEKKLKWETTVEEIFGKVHPDYKKTNLGMLLAHRSGVVTELMKFNGGSLWTKIWDQQLMPINGRQLVATEILKLPAESVPGSQYSYSNAGYIIAGAMLEKVTGKSWEDLMREKIFMPLKMHSCGFGAPANVWGHRDLGRDKGTNFEVIRPGFTADNPPTLGPAGTVHCNMSDWMKFLQLHLDGHNGKPTLLSKSSFEKLHQSYTGQTYTFGGWDRQSRPWADGIVFTHSGSNTSFYAVVWLAPKKNLSIISLTNYGGARAFPALDETIGALIQD